MQKESSRRQRQGVTIELVMNAVVQLFNLMGGESVSRQALLKALPLMQETTMDDRLRVLVKSGSLQSAGRGRYRPNPAQFRVAPASPNTAQQFAYTSSASVPASTGMPMPFRTLPAAPPPESSPGYYFLSAESDPGLAEAIRHRQGKKGKSR